MNHELWHADIEVTETLVRTCLQNQFPALMPITSLECIGEGWDNKVFLLNEKIIFRFPRRKIATELIENESRLLNNLQSMFDVKIPHPEYIGQPTTHYPYSFHGYPVIKGLSGDHAQLSDEERLSSLPLVARFLKQLHSIDEKKALALGATLQAFDRTNIEKTVNTLRECVDKIIARNILPINKSVFEQEMIAAQQIKLSDERCLVHGDLYCRHLLFDQGKLSGIIDWGDTGINHKAVDLSVIWSFYPASSHSQFFELYGEVDLATWQYARFLGLYIMLMVLLYGHAISDQLLVAEATRAIQCINFTLYRS